MLFALSACPPVDSKPDAADPIDECVDLPAITATTLPTRIRVNSAAEILPEGGSGRYAYTLAAGGSGGEIRGNRLIAGPTPMNDRITVADDCGNSVEVNVDIISPFLVEPARAAVRPGTSFAIRTQGLIGSAQFSADALGSSGSISPSGTYTAGANAGLDLIRVKDSGTGEEVLLQFTVSTTALFRAVPAKLAVPAGAQVPLVTQDGSGLVDWVKLSGPGTASGGNFVAALTDTGTAELEGTDRFTNEKTRVKVRVLEELSRSGKPHGRLTDVTNVVTADFDGDGIADVAVGVPESDLGRPQGGAVFIYKGSAAGLPAEATWTLVGESDTAQLGAVLVAGDLDGDGKADLAVSEPGADVTIADSGAVLLYRFTSTGPEQLRAPLTGLGRGNFGASLAIADMDGDGDNDLIVGSPGADLAGGASNTRGVVDVFILQKGQAIPDLGAVRIGGADLAVDGTVRSTNGIRLGRVMAVGDLNGDGRADLAAQVTVNNTLLGGVPAARNQTAIQVHFGRANSNLFEAAADVYVLPTNSADGNEGTWRLGIIPAEGARPALLMTVADRADSPNLTSTGGTAGGSDGGGALLFDLSAYKPTGPAGNTPTQVGRTDAWARIYGDSSGITAGRSFAVADIDGAAGLELILGAPYGSGTNLSTAGKLLSYPLGALSAGAVVNKPADFRIGGARMDVLGTGLATWTVNGSTSLVAVASRATTAAGDFTGRVDAFSGSGLLATWTATSAVLPARLAAEQFGVGVEAVVVNGAVKVLVGAPGFSGPGSNNDGNDVGAGQALLYALGGGATPSVLVEGAGTAYVKNNVRVYGGRTMGIDVASTDFDGDGRVDLAVSAPNFVTPATTTTEYATNVTACMPATAQTNGGVLVFLGQTDGTFKEGFRLFAVTDIPGCTPAATTPCRRSQLSRTGIVGGFDFNNDNREDLMVTRANGFEVFLGRAPDDATLAKPTMECTPGFTFPYLAQAISMPAALGDVDGDGCDDLGMRYTDGTRLGFIVAFGFDAGGACGAGSMQPAWVRVSGDSEVGVNQLRLGTAISRAGRVLGDARDFLAVTADVFPYMGVAQPAVLLYDYAQLAAKKPAAGGAALAGALGDGLVPIPVLYKERAPGLGRSISGGADVTGDGVPDLVVGAPGANVNGDGTGAVFIFEGGAALNGPRPSWMTLAADQHERGAFGQDLCLSPLAGATRALAVGAPVSYRTGTANGSAWVTALDL